MSQIDETQPNLLEVPASNLQPGMYVAQLDRPWLETPFAVQGFYVRNNADAEFVGNHCAYVYVDPRRFDKKLAAKHAKPTKRSYNNSTTLKNEFKSAQPQLESAADAMKKVFDQVRAGGHLNLRAAQKAIGPLVDSVLRNNEAMAALIRLKSKGNYLYQHSLSNAVWAAVFGRHLGLDVPTLKQLALGAALLDIGMTLLPDELLGSSEPLSMKDLMVVRKHVKVGLEMLGESGDVHNSVLAIVRTHHERQDGSGYPNGIEGTQIPLFGRIAGLVDSYDAMITPRPYARARTSFEAMHELSDLKDQLFQAELVEQFMQAIGLFPTGTIVELNTGEVGVVVAQNLARRLKPKIVIILNADKQRHDKLVIVDLGEYASDDGSDLWIVRELDTGAHGIEPGEYFL